MEGIAIYYKDKDGGEHYLDELLLIDAIGEGLATITYPHFKVHEGTSFFTDYVDEGLGDDATIIIAFKIPVGKKKAHMIVEYNTLVGGDLAIWEDPTWTTNTGTARPIRNRNRSSVDTSMLLEDKSATPAFTATNNVLVNVTGLNTGSAILLHHFYSWGKKEKIQAGSARDAEELILKPDTQYAVVFTADGASNKAQVILNWYEQIDKN